MSSLIDPSTVRYLTPLALALASSALIPSAEAQCPLDVVPLPGTTPNYYTHFVNGTERTAVVRADRITPSGTEIVGRVFDRQDARWVEVAELSAVTTPYPPQHRGAIDTDDRFVVIGVDKTDIQQRGRAYVYEKVGEQFVFVQELQPATPAPGSNFGREVAVVDGVIMVTAPNFRLNGSLQGAVFVFERIGGQFTQTDRVDPPTTGGQNTVNFGTGFHFDGERLVAGPTRYISGFYEYGLAFYEVVNDEWAVVDEIRGRDFQGTNIAVHGDTLADGRTGDGIHVYERGPMGWSEVQHIIGNPLFGTTITMNERWLAASSGPTIPIYLVYDRRNGTFEQRYREVGAPGSRVGSTLAVVGDDMLGVWPTNGETNLHVYELESGGTSFCASPNANAAVDAGLLELDGCAVAGSSNPTFIASRLPAFATSLFLTSQQTAAVPGNGGGLGKICIGGAIGRFGLGMTNASGEIAASIDLDAVPGPTGPRTAMHGETWYVQVIHRDPQPSGLTTNTTSALAFVVR